MTFRLPSPAGLLIDRGRTLAFRFESSSYQGHPGDTIASALAAQGVALLSRSFKYHRARGLLSGAGLDGNTLVQLLGAPNVPADHCALEDGLDVSGQHYRGSLARDRDAFLEKLAWVMPVGFYYRAFFRPLGIWQKFWEPMIRARAGLGRIELSTVHRHFDKQHLFCDVAVIGAGPAGLSAALEAAEAGQDVLLVSDESYLGGSLAYARFEPDSGAARRLREDLVRSVLENPRITVMQGTTCTGWFADHWLSLLAKERLYKMRAKRTVFAVGAIEQPVVFRNNDLPGIMSGSAVQRLIHLYGVKPGQRAVVLAGNDHAFGVALDLSEAGVEIATIADLRPERSAAPLANEAMRRGLPVQTVRSVTEAVADRGRTRVKAIVLDGVPYGCDLVCMCTGYAPAYQLPAQAGASVRYDDRQATFVVTPQVGSGVAIAGAVNGVHELGAVRADGARAGRGDDHAVSNGVAVNLPWPIYPHPQGKDFVDFDEDLQVADLVNSVSEGYRDIELVKRFSTLGMGPSQGRQSALNAARIVARERGVSAEVVGVTTARPPAFGEPLAQLAGQGFHPERRTPMHDRHLAAGAQMIAVGAWWRPSYYGGPERRETAIAAEVEAIHRNVGMIDVSTLGKIELRGPDAAAFFERIATFVYAKQPVGSIRYHLMTNEAGTVVDDGIAARLDAEHFYITATTGAVDNTFRQMQWWNAQWRMKVDIANVTGGYAAVNIAGPRSRELLSKLAPEFDLSPGSFPYLAVREEKVAGIPARMLRIGFVGELGYEIHVPQQMGEALWDQLMAAGAALQIRPAGMEAQRMLRLEKGHIIIGQDTDGMTTPAELGMEWAVGKKKPFFVGSRSLGVRGRQKAKRRLVGFGLPLDGPVPQESCIIVHKGEMAGMVTSAARSRQCAKVIGLAYVPPELSETGQDLTIRLADRTDVTAKVTALPFYDPGHARLTC